MSIQTVFSREGFVAKSTRPLLRERMCIHMLVQIRFRSEASLAFVTSKWTLVPFRPFVKNQQRPGSESFFACFALMRLRVGGEVLAKVALLRKRLMASVAGKVLLPAIVPMGRLHGLVAFFASKPVLFFLMQSQRPVVQKFSFASSALFASFQ